MWLFHYFNSKRNYNVLKLKSPYFLLNKNINSNKNNTKLKMEIPHTLSERRTMCFSSYKNRELKVKLWRAGARERKKSAFFVKFILSVWHFFNICVLPQCIVYWINFQNIYTCTYQKTLLRTLFCLFLKSSKAFSVSLSSKNVESKVWLAHAVYHTSK